MIGTRDAPSVSAAVTVAPDAEDELTFVLDTSSGRGTGEAAYESWAHIQKGSHESLQHSAEKLSRKRRAERRAVDAAKESDKLEVEASLGALRSWQSTP